MTTALVLLGLVAYLGGAAACVSRICRRIDGDFTEGMNRVLRSRGGSEAAARPTPQGWVAAAGGDARIPTPVAAALPPAPQALAGAACPPATAASARPHLARLGGER